MADPALAVLLRNGNHANATIKYALKCNDVAISYARTPIQIPIAQQSPEIIDLGFYRPSITVTGLVDTIGGNTSNTTLGFAGMESIPVGLHRIPMFLLMVAQALPKLITFHIKMH